MKTEQLFKQLVVDIQQRFGEQSLSALDNTKLLMSILNADGQQAQAFIAQSEGEQPEHQGRYIIQWNVAAELVWIDCGACNNYSCDFSMMTATQIDAIDQIEPIHVAILPAEQLGLLFMQYAHFDHC